MLSYYQRQYQISNKITFRFGVGLRARGPLANQDKTCGIYAGIKVLLMNPLTLQIMSHIACE